jgi:hypothetical protein
MNIASVEQSEVFKIIISVFSTLLGIFLAVVILGFQLSSSILDEFAMQVYSDNKKLSHIASLLIFVLIQSLIELFTNIDISNSNKLSVTYFSIILTCYTIIRIIPSLMRFLNSVNNLDFVSNSIKNEPTNLFWISHEVNIKSELLYDIISIIKKQLNKENYDLANSIIIQLFSRLKKEINNNYEKNSFVINVRKTNSSFFELLKDIQDIAIQRNQSYFLLCYINELIILENDLLKLQQDSFITSEIDEVLYWLLKDLLRNKSNYIISKTLDLKEKQYLLLLPFFKTNEQLIHIIDSTLEIDDKYTNWYTITYTYHSILATIISDAILDNNLNNSIVAFEKITSLIKDVIFILESHDSDKKYITEHYYINWLYFKTEILKHIPKENEYLILPTDDSLLSYVLNNCLSIDKIIEHFYIYLLFCYERGSLDNDISNPINSIRSIASISAKSENNFILIEKIVDILSSLRTIAVGDNRKFVIQYINRQLKYLYDSSPDKHNSYSQTILLILNEDPQSH